MNNTLLSQRVSTTVSYSGGGGGGIKCWPGMRDWTGRAKNLLEISRARKAAPAERNGDEEKK